MPEVQDGRFVGNCVASELQTCERAHRADVVKHFFRAGIGEVVPLKESLNNLTIVAPWIIDSGSALMDQLSFASLDYAAKKKHTKRDVFLAEMAAVVPWVALEAVIEPHYPKAGPNGGRRPFPLAVMLRIYCLQR